MNEKIISVYTLTDDILITVGHHEDSQRKVSDAEVITVAVVAMRYFCGNFEKARIFLREFGYIPNMLSKSRFCRRLRLIQGLLSEIFCFLSEIWKKLNTDSVYLIDSFPVAVCDNIRIQRSKIFRGEDYRGYNASKRRYFYGLKVHMMSAATGEPVEIFLTPGSISDTGATKMYNYDLPADSTVYGDKAYNVYEIEELLKETGNIRLMPIRKKNSLRKFPPYTEYLQKTTRKAAETANSLITGMFPKSIHAVTADGFALKIFLFVLSYSFGFAI